MPPDLSGHTVVLTRAEHQLGAARKLFEAAGAQVLDLPALVIGPPDSWGPLDDALGEPVSYTHLTLPTNREV